MYKDVLFETSFDRSGTFFSEFSLSTNLPKSLFYYWNALSECLLYSLFLDVS